MSRIHPSCCHQALNVIAYTIGNDENVPDALVIKLMCDKDSWLRELEIRAEFKVGSDHTYCSQYLDSVLCSEPTTDAAQCTLIVYFAVTTQVSNADVVPVVYAATIDGSIDTDSTAADVPLACYPV